MLQKILLLFCSSFVVKLFCCTISLCVDDGLRFDTNLFSWKRWGIALHLWLYDNKELICTITASWFIQNEHGTLFWYKFSMYMLLRSYSCLWQSSWVRNWTAGMVASVAKSLNIADVHCNLVPMLQPYIKQQIIQVEKEVSLFGEILLTLWDFLNSDCLRN